MNQDQIPQEELTPEQEAEIIRDRQMRIDEILRRREESFLDQEKSLLTWKAPSRLFKHRTKEDVTTIGAGVLLVCVILVFIQQFMLILVVLAFSFVMYAFASVKPEDVEHEITTRGLRTSGTFYRWDSLSTFWFDTTEGKHVLYVTTLMLLPKVLVFIVDGQDTDQIQDMLAPYILHEKPEPDMVDKAKDWFSKKMPVQTK